MERVDSESLGAAKSFGIRECGTGRLQALPLHGLVMALDLGEWE
jgi:hypothetical protein